MLFYLHLKTKSRKKYLNKFEVSLKILEKIIVTFVIKLLKTLETIKDKHAISFVCCEPI